MPCPTQLGSLADHPLQSLGPEPVHRAWDCSLDTRGRRVPGLGSASGLAVGGWAGQGTVWGQGLCWPIRRERRCLFPAASEQGQDFCPASWRMAGLWASPTRRLSSLAVSEVARAPASSTF